MIRIESTSEFDKWIRKLKDIRAKAKILFRIQNSKLTDTLETVSRLEKVLAK